MHLLKQGHGIEKIFVLCLKVTVLSGFFYLKYMHLQILVSPRCILSGPKSYLRHLAKKYSGKPCDRFVLDGISIHLKGYEYERLS